MLNSVSLLQTYDPNFESVVTLTQTPSIPRHSGPNSCEINPKRDARLSAEEVFSGQTREDGESRPGFVQIQMLELLETVKVCMQQKLLWINDFADDSVWITEDLNDVMAAFRTLRDATGD